MVLLYTLIDVLGVTGRRVRRPAGKRKNRSFPYIFCKSVRGFACVYLLVYNRGSELLTTQYAFNTVVDMDSARIILIKQSAFCDPS